MRFKVRQWPFTGLATAGLLAGAAADVAGTAMRDPRDVENCYQMTKQANAVNENTSSRNRHAYIYNRTRESFVATEAKVADGYFSRLVGLLGKTRRWARPGQGLWIVPSHGVHTIGMLFSLDLIFLDRKKVVVHLEQYVRPFRISSVSLKAASVLELPTNTIFRTGTQLGDQLEICRGEPHQEK